MSTKHHRISLLLAMLMASAAPGIAQENAPPSARPRDLEGMYTRAAYILDDPNISNVHGVTAMLERCTQWGHPLAAALLMDVYEGRRKGLSPQPQKAAELARTLATGELVLTPEHPESTRVQNESMFRYALYCENGYGREKSEREAVQWMLKAANAGVGRARAELARYLMDTRRPYSNPRRALQILIAQAKQDPYTPNVFFYLGHIYMRGLGLPRPMPHIAFECYELGERVKDPRAINNLAAMYERGITTTRNLGMALQLYKKAADLGNREASANMQRLAYIRAELETGTPHDSRVNHAATRVIETLPVSPRVKRWLTAPFRARERRAQQRP